MVEEKEKQEENTIPTQDQKADKSTNIYEWQAPEWDHYEKTRSWTISLIVLVSAFFVFGLLLEHYLFSIFVVLAGCLIYVYAHKRPQIVDFQITKNGIQTGDRFYPYREIQSFWVLHEPPEINDLVLRIDRTFLSHIRIPLNEEVHPQEIRESLLEFLPEEEYEESFAEIIGRWFKF